MNSESKWLQVSVDTVRRGWSRLTPLLIVLVAGILLPALPARAQGGDFVYVVNELDNNVSAYTIDGTTGALTAVPGSPFAAGTGPVLVTVAPNGHFAYVANSASTNVSAYTIDGTTGALTAVPGSPFAAGDLPFSVAVDPTSRFAYVANALSNNVSAYTIDAATGALIANVPGSPFAAGTQPALVTVAPNGHFAYVANFLSDNVFAYTIDPTTGALPPIPGSPFPAGLGPSSAAVDPKGQFVYVPDYNSNALTAYTIDPATGALTPIPGSPFSAAPSSVAVDPKGQFVYVTNYDYYTVSAYTIDAATGALIDNVPGSPFPAGTAPFGVAATAGPASRPAPPGVYPAMSVSPQSLSFGNQVVGSSSVPQTVILRNTGTAPLQFNAIYTTGDFSEATACSSPLVPGTSCSINIAFTPTARYARTGTLVISSSEISQTDTVALSGTGTVAIDQLSPGSLNFGYDRVNTSSASQNVTLSNTGDGPLTLSAIFTTGPYSQKNNCPSSIPPGTVCNIAVVFTPTVRGTVNGTLNITGNQQGTAPVTALVGTGTGH